ncbi:S9 family peptidase [Deinococcus yavapaiensis]|uniref:Dipeptidyl aminopeptidase/acylaminoacyl peptidase n=1 Tax=Deinococcus yavapaiensis KR-236 TaxID=694435 RepID=A0A318SCP3_9DEIO|nr:S9 family peptidase [Deinococcus yavapaiensis]PYE55024.1 dipeptidyl aminopeptidase/acylaminoacyl peptidase [Deinococcus yavapaiensis KR-236]
MPDQDQTVYPYGAWPSPITSEAITAGTVGLSDLAVDGVDVYWVEMRPFEGGRSVLVKRGEDGTVSDVTPAPFDVRTRVHEYGGRCYAVHAGTVYFSHFADGRLYRQTPGGTPEPITPKLNVRFADPVLDLPRERIIAVREDHRDGGHEPRNELVTVELAGENTDGGVVIATGADFYASPRLSPDGTRLAWTEWDHPNMPWDDTRLMLADVAEDGALRSARQIAGGPGESALEPRWSPAGMLHFVSDRTGWWNLYRLGARVEALCPMEAEFGEPQWVFSPARSAFLSEDSLMCAYDQGGQSHLAVLERAGEHGRLRDLDTAFSLAWDLQVQGSRVVCLAGAPDRQPCVVRLSQEGDVEVVHEPAGFRVDPRDLSVPEAIAFPTEGGRIAHAFFYPPRNALARGPEGERPPLLVIGHGGPTGATFAVLSPFVQFWTTRGFAVLDVNYGGSTGFGREYRERLRGQWGVVDVQDCVNAARFVAQRGDVDARRMAITGASAGGYTVLCALTFHDVFTAGASHFGVSDAETLAQDTHKFESRYLDSLIGPYPEMKELYRARSPIHFTERLSRPVVFFQGLEDKVVPPDQARRMFEAVRSRGLPTALVEFEGEGHGFRRAENIRRALEGELLFYGQVFGFTPPDLSVTLPIENVGVA